MAVFVCGCGRGAAGHWVAGHRRRTVRARVICGEWADPLEEQDLPEVARDKRRRESSGAGRTTMQELKQTQEEQGKAMQHIMEVDTPSLQRGPSGGGHG